MNDSVTVRRPVQVTGIDCGEVPPCQMESRFRPGTCGRPSRARVRFWCTSCGYSGVKFFCGPHVASFESGLWCRDCQTLNSFRYRVT